MASLSIRNMKESVKASLRVRAARNGHSMEEEVRRILEQAADQHPPEPRTGAELYQGIRALVKKYGPWDVELPKRMTSRRQPPKFD